MSALTFHAQNASSPFLMGFGKPIHWLADHEITPEAVSEYTQMFAHHEGVSIHLTTDEERPGSPKAINVKIGNVTVAVTRPHVPEGRNWQFLNLQVSGLDSLGYPLADVGGVMGPDSPRRSKSKSTCLSSTRKLNLINYTRGISSGEHPPVLSLQELGIHTDADVEAHGDL
eukprot:gnl/TRDRNA2_/TRDRNA2_153222_c0_seq1.p1 gnl/TRDRNA2_/TRDRNA2_153222_c0~~gnl/TRDRNA2_/TRDRNA2_153222_c0_seq1.p1  ORF type:complete len:201 (-),score=14.29 gnl/TRDRNA2_/TRDRNA2_153222_c0_seq1:109-621(-)